MKTDYEKFQAVGRVRAFATNASQMFPIGNKVRIISEDRSIDIDIAKYVQKGLSVPQICKWLQFMREVLNE